MNKEVFQARSPAASEPTNFQEKYFLVIDDVASMRASLRTTVGTLGGGNLGGAVFMLFLP